MKPSERKIYFLFMAGAWLLVMIIASFQFNVIYGEFKLKFLIAPTIVSLVAGYLMANQYLLRAKIQQQQKRFTSIVEMAEALAYLQREDSSYEFISSSCVEMTGYSQTDFYQEPGLLDQLVHDEFKFMWQSHHQKVLQNKSLDPIVVKITPREGDSVWIRHDARAVLEKGKVVGISSTNIDISEQIQQSETLKDLSLKDPLTSLPNRRYFYEQANLKVKQAESFKIVIMDLDRFKNINDSLGHSMGDVLLQEVSGRLQQNLPKDAVISRFGGDEFVMLLHSNDDAEKWIKGVLAQINQPYSIDGHKLYISASFGWALYPNDAEDIETLLRYADMAMYLAKKSVGISFVKYSDKLEHHNERFIKLETDLHQAIQQRQLHPYFQPLMDSKTQQIVGVECLARWHSESFGWVSPEEFIFVAESTNLIDALGELILEQSLAVAQKVNDLNLRQKLYFSVNVSAVQLSQKAFVNTVVSLLKKYEVPAARLVLEVTESFFIGGHPKSISTLNELRSLGVKVALDDFGTGYSAMAVLKEDCLDLLKIDKSFVANIVENELERHLTFKIIETAHLMGLVVVGEGVEIEPQQQILSEGGCDVLQGYLLGRPMPESELMERVSEAANL